MKKIFVFFVNTPGLLAIFVLVVVSCMLIFSNVVFPCISENQIIDIVKNISIVADIAIALALLEITFRIGYGQIKVQKDNIKLQMFDKRYKVFQAIVDARSLLNRDDHIMNAVHDDSYVKGLGVQMTEMYNQLRENLFISQTLYDNEIFEKMNRILSFFNNSRKNFYQLGIAGLKYKELIKANELQIQQILILNADNVEQMNIALNKLMPEFDTILKPWQESVIEFNNYLETSGIKKDFDKYIMIHNLDK